jgi:hypothetical protein
MKLGKKERAAARAARAAVGQEQAASEQQETAAREAREAGKVSRLFCEQIKRQWRNRTLDNRLANAMDNRYVSSVFSLASLPKNSLRETPEKEEQKERKAGPPVILSGKLVQMERRIDEMVKGLVGTDGKIKRELPRIILAGTARSIQRRAMENLSSLNLSVMSPLAIKFTAQALARRYAKKRSSEFYKQQQVELSNRQNDWRKRGKGTEVGGLFGKMVVDGQQKEGHDVQPSCTPSRNSNVFAEKRVGNKIVAAGLLGATKKEFKLAKDRTNPFSSSTTDAAAAKVIASKQASKEPSREEKIAKLKQQLAAMEKQ